MTIAGLPAQILMIHAAVVFGPLSALAALAYVGLPRYRDTLRWPVLVVVVIGVGAIWAAYITGNNFFASDRFANFSGEARAKIEKHQQYAQTLRWIASGFGLVTVAATYLHDRTGATRTALSVLVGVGAVGTLVWVLLTGDAGSRAVWS
jgi:uncharacterized membrane protein